ncbi:HlyD family secretion protein [Planktotalea sp.]|uniref:HlyD family secretion protein n=1 Tax=Planktotalea sp. TaxID=2029877 RepID=UPI003F6A7C1F
MMNQSQTLKAVAICAAMTFANAPFVLAQSNDDADGLEPVSFAGTVVARDITGISYETSGCIVTVSETARRTGNAQAGQVLVELDSQAAELSYETAMARVADLEAAVSERQLAIDAAEASVNRRTQEQALVAKEFARTEQIFRRGLVNEATMEGVESRMMNTNFATDQAREALASAISAKSRAEIALRIGSLELRAQTDALEDLIVRAPFDGVLLDFESNVGDCVTARTSATQIYTPSQKSVEMFVRVNQLVGEGSSGVSIGAPVKIKRFNGSACNGAINWIGTQADVENQFIKSSIEVDETCAQDLFLNEAVEVQTMVDAS